MFSNSSASPRKFKTLVASLAISSDLSPFGRNHDISMDPLDRIRSYLSPPWGQFLLKKIFWLSLLMTSLRMSDLDNSGRPTLMTDTVLALCVVEHSSLSFHSIIVDLRGQQVRMLVFALVGEGSKTGTASFPWNIFSANSCCRYASQLWKATMKRSCGLNKGLFSFFSPLRLLLLTGSSFSLRPSFLVFFSSCSRQSRPSRFIFSIVESILIGAADTVLVVSSTSTVRSLTLN